MKAGWHLGQVLERHGITMDDVLRESRRLETSRASDRRLALARQCLRRREPGRSYVDAGIAKPRSGRPLGRKHVQLASAGGRLSRRARGKLLRAVNALLAARGVAPIEATNALRADA